MLQNPIDSLADNFRIDVQIVLPFRKTGLLENPRTVGREPDTRRRLVPVASEQTERPVGIHKRQLSLVTDVQMVESLSLLSDILLVCSTHVVDRVKVDCKAEHVLLGTVHWKVD